MSEMIKKNKKTVGKDTDYVPPKPRSTQRKNLNLFKKWTAEQNLLYVNFLRENLAEFMEP